MLLRLGDSLDGRLHLEKVYQKEEYLYAAIFELDYICIFGPCYKDYRRKLITNYNLRFLEEYRLSEERIFHIQAMGVVDRVSMLSYVGYYYTENQNFLTHM